MDAEDVHQLLKRTRIHCQVLEVDRDVAISRAAEYRKIILGGLEGEGGATQPQAADIFRMPVRASALNMDAGDVVHQLLKRTQRHCRVLEVDRNIEILTAAKYRKLILDGPEGEGGATQPQPADIFRMPEDALRPTATLTEAQAGSSRSTIARCPSTHPPVAGRSRAARGRTAAAVPQAHSDSDEDVIVLDEGPRTGVSASTSVSQPRGKKRNLSSLENPTQRISTRSRPSFDILPESSRASTSGSRSLSMSMPGLGDIPFAGILKRARLTPLELTRAEASRVEETPGIERATFSKVFGGLQKSEWPQCSKFPGYSDFLLADIVVQPFAPDAAGKPGLLLRLPTVIETPGSEKYEIHVLSNTLQGDGLHYRGKYTRVPIPAVRRIHFDWSGLPYKFQERWVKRVTNSWKPGIRALRARIQLRNKHGREPSATEVQAHLQCFDNQVTHKEVAAAFRSGKEKLVLEGLHCTGYDSCLATIIQKTVQANDVED